MFFSIHADNGVPIYDQIVRQVKYAVAEATLTPGQLLPSVRTLATDLAVNPNTVARAYQQLQSEGVLQPLRGRGLVVDPAAVDNCRQQRLEIITGRLSSALQEALHAGMSPADVRKLVSATLDQIGDSTGTIHGPAGSGE